jgi:hypothetical protein
MAEVQGSASTDRRRFGAVEYEGPALPAPDLPISTLVPKGRTR